MIVTIDNDIGIVIGNIINCSGRAIFKSALVTPGLTRNFNCFRRAYYFAAARVSREENHAVNGREVSRERESARRGKLC